jgi:hypothetical protein
LRSVGTELLLKIWNGILLQNVFGFCCLNGLLIKVFKNANNLQINFLAIIGILL